jgi:hypothetical protein
MLRGPEHSKIKVVVPKEEEEMLHVKYHEKIFPGLVTLHTCY